MFECTRRSLRVVLLLRLRRSSSLLTARHSLEPLSKDCLCDSLRSSAVLSSVPSCHGAGCTRASGERCLGLITRHAPSPPSLFRVTTLCLCRHRDAAAFCRPETCPGRIRLRCSLIARKQPVKGEHVMHSTRGLLRLETIGSSTLKEHYRIQCPSVQETGGEQLAVINTKYTCSYCTRANSIFSSASRAMNSTVHLQRSSCFSSSLLTALVSFSFLAS